MMRAKVKLALLTLAACAHAGGPPDSHAATVQQMTAADRDVAAVNARLNSMANVERDLEGVSAQRAHGVGYFDAGVLRKATLEQQGASYEASTSFYFSGDGALVFVDDREDRYDSRFDAWGLHTGKLVQRAVYYGGIGEVLLTEEGVIADAARAASLGDALRAISGDVRQQLSKAFLAANPSFLNRVATYTFDAAGNAVMLPSSSAAISHTP